MVGDKQNKKQLGRNRAIPKTQLGFSLDQQFFNVITHRLVLLKLDGSNLLSLKRIPGLKMCCTITNYQECMKT